MLLTVGDMTFGDEAGDEAVVDGDVGDIETSQPAVPCSSELSLATTAFTLPVQVVSCCSSFPREPAEYCQSRVASSRGIICRVTEGIV